MARDVIPAELEKLGAQVDVVEAYRNVVPENAAARAHEIFSARQETGLDHVHQFVDGARIALRSPAAMRWMAFASLPSVR